MLASPKIDCQSRGTAVHIIFQADQNPCKSSIVVRPGALNAAG